MFLTADVILDYHQSESYIMSTMLLDKLKPEFHTNPPAEENGILLCLDEAQVQGDNAKYMKFYNRLASVYDLGERWFGRLAYGNEVAQMRQQFMKELEWFPGCSALYVSIGTGTDLRYLPDNIEVSAIDWTGADISLGMLKKCQKIWGGRANLNLVNCAAEDLPFIDQSFDVVLHVGGINFFSDKKRAIEEMIRVAKPGTKIMIADETSDYIDSQYKKNVLTRKAYKNATFDLSEIEALIPEDMEDASTSLLWNDQFYCITFGVPQN